MTSTPDWRLLKPISAASNTQLGEINAGIRQLNDRMDRMQLETNARIDQLNDRMDRMQLETNARIDQINDRIDQLNDRLVRVQQETAARIDRVFWGVIAVGLVVASSIAGTMLTLIFRLT